MISQRPSQQICYFLFGCGFVRLCAKSDAATSFSFLVLFGSRKILPASEAGFFPVAMLLSQLA